MPELKYDKTRNNICSTSKPIKKNNPHNFGISTNSHIPPIRKKNLKVK